MIRFELRMTHQTTYAWNNKLLIIQVKKLFIRAGSKSPISRMNADILRILLSDRTTKLETKVVANAKIMTL